MSEPNKGNDDVVTAIVRAVAGPPVRTTRRSARVPCQLQVEIDGKGRRTVALTEDISFHGLGVHVDGAHTAAGLIRFRVHSPVSAEPLRLLGVAARCESCEHGGAKIGLSLFGNDRETERRWVEIVRAVTSGKPIRETSSADDRVDSASRAPTEPAPAPEPAPASAPVDAPSRAPMAVDLTGIGQDARPIPERAPAPTAVYHGAMLLRSVDELDALARDGATLDGFFLHCRHLVPAGAELVLRLFALEGSESVTLRGRIVRAVDSMYAGQRGLAFRFDPQNTTDASWNQLRERILTQT